MERYPFDNIIEDLGQINEILAKALLDRLEVNEYLKILIEHTGGRSLTPLPPETY